MSVQDLSCWHDRRTVDNAHGRSGYLSFQQFDRATDRAEAPASVTDGAAIPSARQLGSSTDSRSDPDLPRVMLSRNSCGFALNTCDMLISCLIPSATGSSQDCRPSRKRL